jgi:chemotaxis family two-component system response regulator Rcp1
MSPSSASPGLFLVKSLTPIEVLVVESNPADALLTMTAFRAAGLNNGMHCVREGDDAIMYLRRQGPYVAARVPDLIFLDLCQPRMSALLALQVIKSTPALSHIPVVVAADADDPAFVEAVYSLNANSFIRKPTELVQFLRCIESCYEYWVSVVTLSRDNHKSFEASAAITN